MDARLKESVSYISSHLDEQIELRDLAGRVFLSPSHFHRLFKNEFGLPLKKFIQNYKLEKAFAMITDTTSKLGILDIALYLGYTNYETFSRAFKRQFQVSPDDLKAILLSSFSNIDTSQSNVHKVLVVTRQKEGEVDGILSNIARDLMSEQFADEELMSSKVISVQALSPDTANGAKVVKNKFAVLDRREDWRTTMEKLKSEGLI